MTAAVTVALGVLSVAAELMTAVREANQVIDEAGEGLAGHVVALRKRLKAEMLFASDQLEVDIQDELAKRGSCQTL